MGDRVRKHPFSYATLGLTLFVGGCTTTDGLATARAANEFQCPADRVVLSPRPDLSDGTYDVDACGHHARYTCIVDYGDSFPIATAQACAREPIGDETAKKSAQ